MGWCIHSTHFKGNCKFVIFYLTFNDGPSGIYSSQVIDVVKFINTELSEPTKLISFISIRNFFSERKKIKLELSSAIVVPMFPGVKNWRYNKLALYFLCLLLQPRVIIGRSVLATQLALKCKNSKRRIVYDGRGAIEAEWKEYNVINDIEMLKEINKLEAQAILLSDFRIAVSHQLVKHWQKNFSYTGKAHVVIPCTLNSIFESTPISESIIQDKRKEMGFECDDVVFVYSGSIAGWQSFDLLYDFIKKYLSSTNKFKILFLSNKDDNITKLEVEFPGQIICKRVSATLVPHYLMAANYGLLIREHSITNQVASPVKFAEYLACDLSVLISENIGDYTEFVLENGCGAVIKDSEVELPKLKDKAYLRAVGLENFTKKQFSNKYMKVFG